MFKSKILRASIVIGVFSFVADIVALFRDRLLASHFGASRTLDIYYSAFKLPDLVFNLLGLGAVSSAFIPVFINRRRESEEDAWLLAKNFTTVIFLAVVAFAVVLWVFAGSVVAVVAPGFVGADRETAIMLTRIMLLSPVLFSLSTIFGSVLQSLERFWAYAIAPVLYNAGIIVGAVYFVPLMARHGYTPILGLGYGVVLGAFAHLVVQATAAYIAGFKFSPHINFRNQDFRKIFRLMIPRTIGLGAYSIDSTVVNALASTMVAGSITVLNVANNLQFVPIAVVGVSVATAVFPKLSSDASGQDYLEFQRKIRKAIRSTLLVVVPVCIAGYVLAPWALNLFFGVGLFKGASLAATASVLRIFLWGVPAQSVIPTLSRGFYALHNTRTPVIISLCAIAINLSLAWILGVHLGYGVQGLATAFAIAGTVQWVLLWLALRRFQKVV